MSKHAAKKAKTDVTAPPGERAAVQECIEFFSYVMDSRHDDTAEAMKEWATEDFHLFLARGGDGKGGPGEYSLKLDLAQFTGFVAGVQQKYNGTQHNNANTRITFTGTDTATATTYCQNWHVRPEGDGHYVFHGVYNDELVKTEAGWRVRSRHQFPLFQQGEPSKAKA